MRDMTIYLGIGIGLGALVLGFIMEGGNPAKLVSISALIIILGGTFGATMTSFSLKDMLRIPKIMKDATQVAKRKEEEIILTLISFAEKSRREGLLILEDDIGELFSSKRFDQIFPKGLQLVVDGTDPEAIKSILHNEVFNTENRKKVDASIFETAGGYSPTMGIIGTVMGLVLVLSNLSDPQNLGPAIAMAFIATLYGIGFANIFWLPLAGKLKLKAKQEKIQQELIIEGILAIQMGDNPAIIKERLLTFLDESKRDIFDKER